jgi:hypothetical protein
MMALGSSHKKAQKAQKRKPDKAGSEFSTGLPVFFFVLFVPFCGYVA